MKIVSLLAALLIAVSAAAQDAPMKPPTPEEIQKMQASLAPGPEHKNFEPLVGAFDMQVTYSMGPGQTMKVAGRAQNRMVLGGRFLVSETTGSMPGLGTIESMTIYGFDRRTDEFTLVGYDTMGTYYVTAAGKKAPGATDVVMKGEVAEHGGLKKYDMVLRWVDANSYASEIIFHLPEGPMKIAEMTFTRAK